MNQRRSCWPSRHANTHDQIPDDAVLRGPGLDEAATAGLNHLVIKVESMQATIVDLAAHGIDAEPPASPDGSDDFWTSWLTDPDGYRIELVQWPAGHPDGMTEADMSGQAARD